MTRAGKAYGKGRLCATAVPPCFDSFLRHRLSRNRVRKHHWADIRIEPLESYPRRSVNSFKGRATSLHEIWVYDPGEAPGRVRRKVQR